MSIYFDRIWAMSNKNTFSIKPIKELLEEEVGDTSGKVWLDPFANESKWGTVTNDLNPSMPTDYHMDAVEFLRMFDNNSVDGVLYDPPYSLRQVSECYKGFGKEVTMETTQSSFMSRHKAEIGRIVKLGGKAICFGWNSAGIGDKYGFDITRILLVPHGGMKNDTIVTVCVKTHEPKDTMAPCDRRKLEEKKKSGNLEVGEGNGRIEDTNTNGEISDHQTGD